MSEAEPELGLGLLMDVDARAVKVHFPAAGQTRQYALESAPLKRVRFKEGDVILSHEGKQMKVVSVREVNGLLTYQGEESELTENFLSDSISFSRPEERLLKGIFDPSDVFQLRVESWQHVHQLRKSELRGSLGCRVDLIPHQFYIASEVASRPRARALLADEVGLGKTIEACLILHRLMVSGKAGRVLILVPEPLIHQWFVELFRRFNLTASLFDEERCEAVEMTGEVTNPFLQDHLILCSLTFLSQNPKRQAQVLEIDWGMTIVDEAHHLEWSSSGASPEYLLVESLGQKSRGLLLLTATPEQLGEESHFARLRLLDPDRYFDFQKFKKEEESYLKIAPLAEKLSHRKVLTPGEKNPWKKSFPQSSPRTSRRKTFWIVCSTGTASDG